MDSPFFTLQEIAFLLLTAEKIIPYQQQYQYNNNPNHVTWNNKHKKHAKSHHEKGIPHQAFHVFSPIKKTYTIIVYALLFHLARCTFFCYYSILLLFYTVTILYCSYSSSLFTASDKISFISDSAAFLDSSSNFAVATSSFFPLDANLFTKSGTISRILVTPS